MLPKKIKYTDYNGEEREETFYFNLNQTEILKMNLRVDGGIEEYVKDISSKKDSWKIYQFFETIILGAYGEKSLDGKRFMKSDEISTAFSQTEAFNVLILELVTAIANGHPEVVENFIKAIIPEQQKESNIPAPSIVK